MPFLLVLLQGKQQDPDLEPNEGMQGHLRMELKLKLGNELPLSLRPLLSLPAICCEPVISLFLYMCSCC